MNNQQTRIKRLERYNLSLAQESCEQQQRITELEEWIAALADSHPQIPEWIQQSARSLLAKGAK